MGQTVVTMFPLGGFLGVHPLPLILLSLLTTHVTCKFQQSTLPTTTPDDGDFFDDDNNKAMYLVLPAMVLIYGGCAAIYCVHRCRRYCKRKSKIKAKEEKRRAKQREKLTFTNAIKDAARQAAGVSVVEVEGDSTMQLQCLDDEDEDKSLEFRKGRTQETNVDSIEDCLEKDNQNLGAVAPGYTDSNLNQEMRHLDNQLKAAFRMTQDPSKAPPPETAINKPVATTNAVDKSDKFNNAAPPASLKTPPVSTKDGAAGSSGTSSGKSSDINVIPIAMEDIESILKIRKKVKKPSEGPLDLTLRSQPDLIPNPNENVMAVRRVHIKAGDKRKFFFSDQ